jgi:hypothetical protein
MTNIHVDLYFWLVLISCGGFLFGVYLAASQFWKMRQIIMTPTSPIRSLKRGGMGGTQVEVKGRIRAVEFLRAPMSGQPCVWYQSTKKMRINDYDEMLEVMKERVEVLEEKIDFKRFHVEDATGKILILPEGAKVEGKMVVQKEKRHHVQDEGFLSSLRLTRPEAKILADIEEESILPVDEPVYVLGEASMNGEHIRNYLQKDDSSDFFISIRTEEEMVAHAKRQIGLGLLIMLLCCPGLYFSLIIGAALLKAK